MSSTLHKPTHIIANEVLKRKEVERELRTERRKRVRREEQTVSNTEQEHSNNTVSERKPND